MKEKTGVVPKKKKIHFQWRILLEWNIFPRKGMLIQHNQMLRKRFPNIFLKITWILKNCLLYHPQMMNGVTFPCASG